LPDRTPIPCGRWMDHRQVIAGLMWRDLPPCCGNWKAVYNRHRRCSGDGTWQRVLSELRADCDTVDDGEWALGMDGPVIRAHHHSAGVRHKPPRDIPAGVLAPTVLDDAHPAMADISIIRRNGGMPRTRPDRMLADKAYSTQKVPGCVAVQRYRGDYPGAGEPKRGSRDAWFQGRSAPEVR